MIHHKFSGLSVSSLRLGMMRVSCLDGNASQFDEREAFRLTDYAFEQGVDYFDTAGDSCIQGFALLHERCNASLLLRYSRHKQYPEYGLYYTT